MYQKYPYNYEGALANLKKPEYLKKKPKTKSQLQDSDQFKADLESVLTRTIGNKFIDKLKNQLSK